MGFRIKSYDPCVSNIVIERKQMTITWHVDDLNIYHAEESDVTKVIERFKGKYGNVRVSRLYKHDYLGMDLEYRDKVKVKVGMVSYLKKILKEPLREIVGVTLNLLSEPPLNVRDEKDRRLLDGESARAFH